MALGDESPNPDPPAEMAEVCVNVISIAIGPFELGLAPCFDIPLGERVEITLTQSFANHPGFAGGIVAGQFHGTNDRFKRHTRKLTGTRKTHG